MLSSPQKKADLNIKSDSALLFAEQDDSFDKINNNLDIEFEKIDEARQGDEISPYLKGAAIGNKRLSAAMN